MTTSSPKDILTAAILKDATVQSFATRAEAIEHLNAMQDTAQADVPPVIIVIGH